MRKKLAGAVMIGILAISHVSAEEFKAPDILVDSKLDFNWSGILITKFRTLLKNFKLSDPFSNTLKEPIVISEKVEQLLSPDSKDLISDFGNAIGLNVLHAETKVALHDFSYDVKGFKTNLKASEPRPDGLVVGTDFSASVVTLSAKKISFSLVIPGKKNSPILNVDILNPIIRASEENLINFFAQIKIQDQNEHFKLQIQKASFDQMAKGLLENPENVEFEYNSIEIPDISLKVGSKKIQFSREKIQNYLRSKHEAIKGILLAQVASSLQANTTQAAFKVLEQYKLAKEHWISSPIMESQIQIANFSSSDKGSNLQINMPADFCTNEKFKLLKKDCLSDKVTKITDSRINKALHAQSVSGMKSLMRNGEADIVASISEDYLNKLLVTTYDAGLWKQALDESGVALGPNKVAMRLNKKGDTGTLLMDVVYKPTTLEKIMTGSKVIRFPLALDVSVRIEKYDGDAVIIVRLNDVDTSDDTLINGRPEVNMISSVKDVPRFKTKVAASIRERLSKLRNKDIIELRYAELNDLGLEKVDFFSDGNGRMNAVMKMEDLMREREVSGS